MCQAKQFAHGHAAWRTLAHNQGKPSWHHICAMTSSEEIHRNAQELRSAAQRLIKEALQLLEKSLVLEEKISRSAEKSAQ
jgi:hypothetical protein